MRRIVFLFILILLSSKVFACINEYRTLLSGEVIYTDAIGEKIWTQQIDTTKLRLKAKKLYADYQISGSINDWSDYAAALIYLGDFAEAKKIYDEIEKQTPGLYTTASNLGTLYELNGKLDSAMFWIKKSMKINQESHGGSEWIHLKILEYQLYKYQDKSVLDLNFGYGAIPENPLGYDLRELKEHLSHQLKERSNFVKPTNRIVGSLYFDLGNITAQSDDLETALECYEAATEYGFESVIMDWRMERCLNKTKTANSLNLREQKKQFLETKEVVWFLLGIGVVLTGVELFRRLRRR